MNYLELDDLLASAAPVTDAEVALWDLGDDDLCAEVMSTPAPLLTRASRRQLVVVAAAALGIAVSVTVGGSRRAVRRRDRRGRPAEVDLGPRRLRPRRAALPPGGPRGRLGDHRALGVLRRRLGRPHLPQGQADRG